jgi:ankyrin repeat protein
MSLTKEKLAMLKKYLLVLSCLFASLHAEQNDSKPTQQLPIDVVDDAGTVTPKTSPFIEEKDWLGRTPLHYAAYYGSERSVEMFLVHGASINVQDNQGNTPLNFLCTKKDFTNLSLIPLMVKNGADIELPDNNGWRPIHNAVRYSNVGVVAKLIECGALLNAPIEENNITLLHLAAQNNADPSIVELLLKVYAAAEQN